MMDDLERQLRDSLRARSQDVEPTPDLWLDVQARRERERRLRWLTVAGVVAAAAVVAVVAVPAAIDALRTGGDIVVGPGPADTERPTPQPTPTDPGPSPETSPSVPDAGGVLAVPAQALGADGPDVFLVGDDGSRGQTIHTFPSAGHSTVVALAVRPGSTADDLTAALLTQAEGMYDLRWLRWDGADATVEAFQDPYNVRNHAMGGSVPAPVWSPDGRHLMWVEDGDEGEPALRAIGWSDGPGTGRSADDNADFGRAVLARGATVRLEDWVWTDGTGTETRGYVTATSVDPSDLTAWRIGVERQGDGALALSSTMGSVPFDEDAVVDHADSHAADGSDDGPTYLLTVGGAGEGDLGLELSWAAAGDRGGTLPLPAELGRGSDPSSIWMTALRGGVLVGTGNRAWVVSIAGEVRPVDGALSYAAFIS